MEKIVGWLLVIVFLCACIGSLLDPGGKTIFDSIDKDLYDEQHLPKVTDIPGGKWVYVTPDTLWVTDSGHYYIDDDRPYYSAYQEDFIQVMREGDGFHVSLTGTKYRWAAFKAEDWDRGVGPSARQVLDFQR